MGVLILDMRSHKIERDAGASSGYDDEVLCANWVPMLALRESHSEHVEMPEHLATANVDAFLRKMYACQR